MSEPDRQGFCDYFVQFGGESTTQVRDRMGLTIRVIIESVADGSKSLLVSHGPSILQFCRRVLNPVPDIHGLKNCCILHFTYDQGQFELISVYNPVEVEYIYGGEE
ncbi:histidine phosphatase family protein [Streptococcus thermophilus]|nr:histidine phosphatase family protein [Streptococcus thermophilus]